MSRASWPWWPCCLVVEERDEVCPGCDGWARVVLRLVVSLRGRCGFLVWCRLGFLRLHVGFFCGCGLCSVSGLLFY